MIYRINSKKREDQQYQQIWNSFVVWQYPSPIELIPIHISLSWSSCQWYQSFEYEWSTSTPYALSPTSSSMHQTTPVSPSHSWGTSVTLFHSPPQSASPSLINTHPQSPSLSFINIVGSSHMSSSSRNLCPYWQGF